MTEFPHDPLECTVCRWVRATSAEPNGRNEPVDPYADWTEAEKRLAWGDR